MKLLSAQQLQEWDAFTILHEPIASVDLMERAAIICTQFIIENLVGQASFKIFCGKGNNGGDGLAIARLLMEKGFNVCVYILELGKIGTEDFQSNLHRLHPITKEIHYIQTVDAFPKFQEGDIIIDALYGTGLSRPLEGLSAALVQHINLAGLKVIAIDLPSGLFVDRSSKGHSIIKATDTLTFQSLKLCFLAAENAAFFGIIHVLNIQLQPSFLDDIESDYSILEKEKLRALVKPRKDFSHKGNFGNALLVAGNDGKMGAAVIAAKACLRAGVGLLTVAIPSHTASILHIGIPEAMVVNRDEMPMDFPVSAMGIGPGLGTGKPVQRTIFNILQQYHLPMVLDADALNAIAQNQEWLSLIAPGSILTPHPKEFDRLFGNCNNDFERWQKAIAASVKYNVVILVKGHYTLIAANGKAWFNNTGNAGLAKGGTGDALTGIITALLAQGYVPLDAAKLGVYLHGLAADLALEKQSMETLLASDVIESLGNAFNYLRTS